MYFHVHYFFIGLYHKFRNDSNSFQNGDQSKAQKGATAFMDNNSLQNDGQSKVQNGVTAFIKGFSMEWDANKVWFPLFILLKCIC